jgi:uncharacterized protein YcfJ
MRKTLATLAAVALAMPVSMTIATDSMARTKRHYSSSTVYKSCRHSSGTAGLIAGGVGGAVLGGAVIGHGLLGPAVGAVGGALGGRAIDRSMTAKKRCTYVRR